MWTAYQLPGPEVLTPAYELRFLGLAAPLVRASDRRDPGPDVRASVVPEVVPGGASTDQDLRAAVLIDVGADRKDR